MALSAKDLRIGNWVQSINRDGYSEITGIRKQKVKDGEYFSVIVNDEKENHLLPEHIFPISLSPEILDKCGFEKLPGSRAMFRIFVDDLELSVSTEFFHFYIDTKWGQAPIKNPICEYLHQLQNLYFALTGKELEIKL